MKIIEGTPHAPYLFRVIEERQAVVFSYRMATDSFEWKLLRRDDEGIERLVDHGDTGLGRLERSDVERIAGEMLAQEA